MKNNPSRDQLTKSLDRRIRHLMIRSLEKFEDRFPDLDDTREGQIYKGDIRNAFNDVIRAQRDELREYDEYIWLNTVASRARARLAVAPATLPPPFSFLSLVISECHLRISA